MSNEEIFSEAMDASVKLRPIAALFRTLEDTEDWDGHPWEEMADWLDRAADELDEALDER